MDVDHNLRRANSLHGPKHLKSKSSSDLFWTPRRALGDVKNNLGTPKIGGKPGFGQRLNFDEGDKSASCSKQTEFGDANANIFSEGSEKYLKPIKNQKQQQIQCGKPKDTIGEMTEQINKSVMTLQLPEIDWSDLNLEADCCSCPHDHDNDLDMYSDVEYLKTLPVPIKDELEDDDPLMSLDELQKLLGSSKFNWKDLLDDEVEFHFDADRGLYTGELREMLEDTLNCNTLSAVELTL